jgi:spore coat protein U-like protein
MRWLAVVPLVLVLAPSSADAQSCSFSVSNVNFGNVDTLSGAAVDVTGTVDLTCSSGVLTNVRVCLNLNAGSGGATAGIRHLRNAANVPLNYNLYQDAARTVPWGSREQPALGSPVAVDFVQILLPVSQSRTIHARILPNQQGAQTGLYTSVFSGAQVSFNYESYLLGFAPSCANVTANTTRPSFTAQANVVPNCNVTAQNIDFGQSGVLATNIDATGSIGVTCTPGTTYNVGLNNGLNGDGPTQRRMTLGGQTVTYGLYSDAARSQPWGNTIGSDTVPGTGAGTGQTITVFGRVPPQTTPPPGTYTDTVVVTVTY